MKFELKDIPAKIQPALQFVKRNAAFLFVIIILAIASFFVFRINQYSNTEPSEDAVSEKLKTVQRPKIDQSVVDRIEQLQGQNIQIQSLFEQARNNPFAE